MDAHHPFSCSRLARNSKSSGTRFFFFLLSSAPTLFPPPYRGSSRFAAMVSYGSINAPSGLPGELTPWSFLQRATHLCCVEQCRRPPARGKERQRRFGFTSCAGSPAVCHGVAVSQTYHETEENPGYAGTGKTNEGDQQMVRQASGACMQAASAIGRGRGTGDKERFKLQLTVEQALLTCGRH